MAHAWWFMPTRKHNADTFKTNPQNNRQPTAGQHATALYTSNFARQVKTRLHKFMVLSICVKPPTFWATRHCMKSLYTKLIQTLRDKSKHNSTISWFWGFVLTTPPQCLGNKPHHENIVHETNPNLARQVTTQLLKSMALWNCFSPPPPHTVLANAALHEIVTHRTKSNLARHVKTQFHKLIVLRNWIRPPTSWPTRNRTKWLHTELIQTLRDKSKHKSTNWWFWWVVLCFPHSGQHATARNRYTQD